jgi:CubicO group peptidase (beta-lactamase class C family)
MDQIIFKPLKLKSTSFGPPQKNLENLATGFQMYYKNYKNVSFKVHSSVSYATGAIYSSVADLYKWHKALQGNFLSEATKELMYKKDLGPYGYGWFTDTLFGKKRVSHDGNIPGYKSNINRMPDEDICVIALSNSNTSAVGGMVRNIIHLLFNKPLSKTFSDQPVISVADSLLKEFTGKYYMHEKDFIGVQISLQQSVLLVKVLNQEPFKMYPVGKNVFKSDGKRIEFRRNDKGEIEFVFMYVRDEFLAARKFASNL